MSDLEDALNRVEQETGKWAEDWGGDFAVDIATLVEAARLVANPDIAIVERKDIEAATMSWAVIVREIDPVQSQDFANTLSAISLLDFFFEKVVAAALTPPGDTHEP